MCKPLTPNSKTSVFCSLLGILWFLPFHTMSIHAAAGGDASLPPMQAAYPAIFWQCRVIYSWGRKYVHQLIWDCYFGLWIRTSFKSYVKGQDFYRVNTSSPPNGRDTANRMRAEKLIDRCTVTQYVWVLSIFLACPYLLLVSVCSVAQLWADSATYFYSDGISPWGLFQPQSPNAQISYVSFPAYSSP